MVAFAGQGVVLVFSSRSMSRICRCWPLRSASVILVRRGAIFHVKSRQLAGGTREAADWDNRLFDRLIDLLDGFKEVRLNKARSDDLFDDVVEVSRNAANIKIRSQSESFKQLVFSQSSMYLLLAAVVFVVPIFSETQGGSIIKITTALMFVVGRVHGHRANDTGLDGRGRRSRQHRAAGDQAAGDRRSRIRRPSRRPKRFDKIEMRNVMFSYVDKSSDAVFQVGPINFTLQPGDLVFITGGNGSGKSTFLKLPRRPVPRPIPARSCLTGVRVNDTTARPYRALIAAIFVDYHLFQRLYGIADPDPAEVDRLLTQFRLADKTRLVDGEFRTLDLSGGQRKRLALIVSLLEKRPILLLDEWTADQDPDFRRNSMTNCCRMLKQAGETVVVITHDDRYLDELDLPCSQASHGRRSFRRAA